MNTQRGFAPILLILLGIVMIGGGIYVYNAKFIQNNTESILENEFETSKVYTNSKFNFSALISPGTKVVDKIDKFPDINKIVTFEDSDNFILVRLVKMGVYGDSLDTWSFIQINEFPKIETMIDNKRALVYSLPAYREGGESFPEQVIAIVEHNGYVYQFEFQNITKLTEKENKFLSGIKFINQTTTTSSNTNENNLTVTDNTSVKPVFTSQDILYKDEKYGYQFLYPSYMDVEVFTVENPDQFGKVGKDTDLMNINISMESVPYLFTLVKIRVTDQRDQVFINGYNNIKNVSFGNTQAARLDYGIAGGEFVIFELPLKNNYYLYIESDKHAVNNDYKEEFAQEYQDNPSSLNELIKIADGFKKISSTFVVFK